MSAEAINSLFNYLQLDINLFEIYYDFGQPNSGLNIPSISLALPKYTGLLSSTGNFYSISGSGFFNGQNLKIQNTENLIIQNSTLLFVFEKSGLNNGVLFSNYNQTSGILIGVNDADKLFFQYYNSYPKVITFSEPLGKRNIVGITLTDNILTFGKYDFASTGFKTEDFFVDISGISNSDNWYLGSGNGYNNYSGYIDEFLFFTGVLGFGALDKLVSGFFTSGAFDYYDVTRTECDYSYEGLTGIIQNITINSLDEISNCIETGYFVFTEGTGYVSITGERIGNICTISGYISGNILSGSGYYETGLLITTGVTGFSFSGDTILSGVTGYFPIELGTLADGCQNTFILSGESGIIAITGSEPYYIDPVTGVTTGIVSGLVTGYFNVPFYKNVLYSITGFTGVDYFIFNSVITCDSSSLINSNHAIYLENSLIQPDGFFVYKTCFNQINLNSRIGENFTEFENACLTSGLFVSGDKIIETGLQIIYNNDDRFLIYG